jgi:ABC-type nitrate/sulfonate/bicarbonate transport system substrate-binding protein
MFRTFTGRAVSGSSTRHRNVTRVLQAGTAALALVSLAACGGDDGGDDGDGNASGKGSVTYAITSPVVPPQLPPYMGPIISGADFGLDMDADNLKTLNDTPTALQLLLSGEIDATSGAFLGYLQARAGQPQLRAFCPEQSTTNAVVVSTNPDVTSLEDLTSDDVRTLVESPGGPNDFFMNAAFEGAGVDIKVEDLTNTRIVENMEQRFAALAAGNADVGVVWNYNVADLEEAVGAENVNVLADFTDYPSVYLAYISTEEWLDENPDEAAAFCAAVLKTNRDLAADFDVFMGHVGEYVEGEPPAEQMEMTWQAANDSSMWPYEDGLSAADVEPLLQLALDNGLLEEPLTYEDVVDDTAFKAALELMAAE